MVRVWESVNGQPHHSVGHYVGQCGRKGLSTWGFYIPSPAVNQGRILIVVFEHRGKGYLALRSERLCFVCRVARILNASIFQRMGFGEDQ